VDCTSDERERHRTQEKRPYDTPSEHSSSQVPEGCEAREPWTIERKHDHVAVVTMNTNKVNAQNPAFFGDLHAAFDRLEAELPSAPRRFSGTSTPHHDFQRLPSRAEAHGLVLTLRSGQLSGSNKGRDNWKLLRQAGATARSLLEAAALTKSRPWALAWRCRFARDEKERHTGTTRENLSGHRG
jgi:hypothetical protein